MGMRGDCREITMNNKLKYALVILGIVVVLIVLALLGGGARFLTRISRDRGFGGTVLIVVIGLFILISSIVGYLKKQKKAQ